MSNTHEKGVCDKHVSQIKGFCDQCGVRKYSDAPPDCQSKMNHKLFSNQIQSEFNRKKENRTEKNLQWKRYI